MHTRSGLFDNGFKRIKFLCFFLLLIPTFLFSQQIFHQTYNGFEPTNFSCRIKASSNGGWAVASSSATFTTDNLQGVVLIKYTACGEVEWGKSYSHSNVSLRVSSFIITSSGDYLVTGYFTNGNNYETFLLKLDFSGNVLWFKVYEAPQSEYIYSVGENKDRGYFIYGNTSTFGGDLGANYIIKTDVNGTVQWSKMYFSNPIWGSAIACSDGGMLIRSGSLIYKINNVGNLLWANMYENVGYSFAPIEVWNGYVFAKHKETTPVADDMNGYVYKLDYGGNIEWVGDGYEAFDIRGIQKMQNGNVAIAGTQKENLLNVPVLIEINASGTIVRQNIIALPGNSSEDLAVINEQSVVLAGIGKDADNNNQLFISKLYADLSSGCFDPSQSPVYTPPAVNVIPRGINPHTINFSTNSYSLNVNDITASMSANVLCMSTNGFVDLGNDTVICPREIFELRSLVSSNYYRWSTGETSPGINVSEPGLYWLETVVNCDTVRDSILVDYFPELDINYTVSPTEATPFDQIAFNDLTENAVDFHWDLGDGKVENQKSFHHQYDQNGNYVTVLFHSDVNGCQYFDTTIVRIKYFACSVPNSFTPNGDGLNDEFGVIGDGILFYNMRIFNRWGEMIFNADNKMWGGTSKNRLLPEGVYVYKIELENIYGEKLTKKGTVHLMK